MGSGWVTHPGNMSETERNRGDKGTEEIKQIEQIKQLEKTHQMTNKVNMAARKRRRGTMDSISRGAAGRQQDQEPGHT